MDDLKDTITKAQWRSCQGIRQAQVRNESRSARRRSGTIMNITKITKRATQFSNRLTYLIEGCEASPLLSRDLVFRASEIAARDQACDKERRRCNGNHDNDFTALSTVSGQCSFMYFFTNINIKSCCGNVFVNKIFNTVKLCMRVVKYFAQICKR